MERGTAGAASVEIRHGEGHSPVPVAVPVAVPVPSTEVQGEPELFGGKEKAPWGWMGREWAYKTCVERLMLVLRRKLRTQIAERMPMERPFDHTY